MEPETIKQLQQAIGTATWKLDLWRFAKMLGSNAETLAKIVGAVE